MAKGLPKFGRLYFQPQQATPRARVCHVESQCSYANHDAMTRVAFGIGCAEITVHRRQYLCWVEPILEIMTFTYR